MNYSLTYILELKHFSLSLSLSGHDPFSFSEVAEKGKKNCRILGFYTTEGLSSSTLTEDALEDGLGELEAGGTSVGDGDL